VVPPILSSEKSRKLTRIKWDLGSSQLKRSWYDKQSRNLGLADDLKTGPASATSLSGKLLAAFISAS